MDPLITIAEHPSVVIVAIFTCLYFILGAIYRLYLCPIAHIPGPRLAALTFWYEFYYDVVRRGQYAFHIEELHKKYGPVIRINPCEIHCIDPEFYDEVYVGSLVAGAKRRTEKWEWSARMFGTTMAAVGTTSHKLHRLRRAGLNSFFSKRSIAELEPVVRKVVDQAYSQLVRRGNAESKAGRGDVVNLRDFFAAFSADLIGEVAFGDGYGLLEKEDFEPGWQRLMMDLSRATHLMKQLPWAYGLLMRIPEKLVALVHPLTKRLFDIRLDIRTKIDATRRAINVKHQDAANRKSEESHPTVLHSLLTNPHLPAHELKTPRLEDEAFTLLGAGTITTAHTLTTIMYHVLANPSIKHRLSAELSSIIRIDPTSAAPKATLPRLETLPYLTATIQEGLRLSFGVSHRLPRINPDAALHYHRTYSGRNYDYTIPPGTPVSMTQMFIHLDPGIFCSPRTFKPERWLSFPNDSGERKEELRRMKHYLVPFSRGTRMCVGMHLAYAELYLMLGALFGEGGVGRRMRLFETSGRDVECVHDFFNPSPGLGSKGVRVRVIDEDEA